MISVLKRYLFAHVLCLLLAAIALADDWPHWFGPNNDGKWNESGIVREFGEDGPRVLWRTDLHAGYSGPAVANNRVFVTDRVEAESGEEADPQRLSKINGVERLLCIDAETGEVNWKHEYQVEYKISYPAGPRSTPVVEEDRVYCLGAMGHLVCLGVETGEVIWKRNFMEDFEIERPPAWGWASHPLLDGEQLICVVGGEGSGVVAFNKLDGKELWRSVTADEMGYASPVIVSRNGHRLLLVWHDVALQGLEPNTGKRVWRIKFPENGPPRPSVAISHPCVFDNHVLVSDFYNGSMVVELNDDLTDAEVVWQSEGPLAEHDENLNSLMAPPMAREGLVFGMSGNGELRCLDGKTGDVKWRDLAPTGPKKTLFATTFIVPNGDRDFLYNDQGELIIAQLTAEGYREFGRAKLLEPTGFARGRNIVWSHPAFANKRMYARNDKELICVDLSLNARTSSGDEETHTGSKE